MKSTKNYYITTPIYYVNDVPHIGHAYTTIAADIMARYQRLNGREVFFLTGTDEHGQKIENTAAENGETPIELADRVVVRFQELWKVLNISNSDFIRTTEQRHKSAVNEIYRKILEKGDIYLGEYEGWYNVREESFITGTQLEEINKLPEDKRPKIDKIKEQSYFFRLSDYQDRLLQFYKENPGFISPKNRLNEVVSFVDGGLRDLSISRTTFSWGIPVPDNPEHVLYVWFDALTNYLTACGYPENKTEFENAWPPDLHLVGKDILRFHAVYWPAFLMSAGLPLPKKVFAHGWWTVDGEKMSKSLGNVVDPYQVADEFGVDVFRYFLMREIPFGQDGDYSKTSLVNRINGELANGLGNLVSRTLGMIEKYFNSKIPTPSEFDEIDKEIERKALHTAEKVGREIENIEYSKALTTIWEFIGDVNKYVDDMQPWTLAKDGETERLSTVLWVLAECIRVINILISPFMPKTSTLILEKINPENKTGEVAKFNDSKKWGLIKPGTSINKGDNLFNRIQ